MRMAHACPAQPGLPAPMARFRSLASFLLAMALMACGSSHHPVAVTGVSLDRSALNLTAGGATATLATTVVPPDASNPAVAWSSSNAAVAAVAAGVVTPLAAGSATITATTTDGGKTATCAVTVAPPVVHVTSVSLDQASLSFVAGAAARTLTPTVSPANATDKSLAWSTSNAAVATVSNGLVAPVGVGSATVTVSATDGGKTAACLVTVSAPVPVTSITLSASSLNLAAGVAVGTLTPALVPADATDKTVTWTTSNAAVAAVAAGVVTPLSAGAATITATAASGANAACAVTVAPAPGPQLIAVGTLDGATDLSGLTGTLENGNPASILGGMGSGLAWAGGNTFLAIPDRGPNAVAYNAAIDNTTSYIARFHTLQLTLTPNPGAGLPYLLAPVMVNTTLLGTQDTLSFGNATGAAVSDVLALGASRGLSYFTGRSDGFAAGASGNPLNARLDPEAIRVSNDGASVFVADEYGPCVYQFDRVTGRRIRTYTLPAGFYVANLSPTGAAEISGNTSGRVANKGMEGLAITPDGTTLVGFVQSALLQDGGDGAKVNRIVTIDVATGATHQFAYANDINGKSYNSSEIVAINNHEFLVDERDGKGLGDGSSAVIKRLYKIDLSGAADIGALSGEANLLPLAVSKSLFLDIRAALNAAGISDTNIPAKIEGVAFGPDLVMGGITKHTLWIANDNDFVSVAGPNKFFVFAVSDADLGSSLYAPQTIAAVSSTPTPVAGLSLSPAVLTLQAGGAAGAITPVVAPYGATTKALSWTSSNPAVATVAGGRIIPLTAGTATITATTADGGFLATCAVTITAP